MVWDATDDAGRPVGSGAYPCRLQTAFGQSPAARLVDQTRRLLLLLLPPR